MTIARSQMNRQLYQLGGGIMQLNNGQEEPIFPRLETLSQNLGQAEQTLGEPSNQFNASSITTAITGRPPMNRGGVASLVDREKYGLGSKIKGALKSAARTFIPKELDPVLKFAAPFLGPVYGPIASIAGSARTGKIDPFSLAAATLPYVQFGGGSGLGSLMPVGYGGSQYGIFGGANVGFGTQGTSLSQMIGDKAKEFLKETVKKDKWDKKVPKAIKTNIVKEMKEYMKFAWDKCENHRGISAGRSISKFKAWLWLLEEDELIKFADLESNYQNYGAPILAKISEKFGFEIPDNSYVKNMIKGEKCGADFDCGCGE